MRLRGVSMLQRTRTRNRRLLAGVLAVWMLLCAVPAPVLAAAGEAVAAQAEMGTATETAVDNPFRGKTISILGDSISTYAGVSNNTAYNSTIGKNAVYYRADGSTLKVCLSDTWWQQAIDALDMKLLVNNSWSGSTVLHTRSGRDLCFW